MECAVPLLQEWPGVSGVCVLEIEAGLPSASYTCHVTDRLKAVLL